MDQGHVPLLREKRKIYYLAFFVMALFLAIFWLWRVYLYPFESTEDAMLQASDLSLSPMVSGQITRMAVGDGTAVKKGDLLFVLDDTLLQIQREKALFAIQHARDEAEVQLIRRELAFEDFTRAKAQFEAGVISLEMMTRSEKSLKVADAMLQSIISMVEVEVADLKMIEKQIELCQVKAPSDGVVAKLWHYAGEVVQAGQTVLTIMDLLNVWVDANIEETKIGSIRIGDPVSLTVDAYPNASFSGNVLVVGAAAASQFALIPANNTSGNFTKVTQRVPLKISFKEPDDRSSLFYLRPGMSVRVKIRAR